MSKTTEGMKVFKDETVDFPLYVIKDFFKDPEFYRDTLLKSEEKRHARHSYIGNNLETSLCFYEPTLFYTLDAASDIIGDYVWVPFIKTDRLATIQFRKQTDPTETSVLAAHTDRYEFLDFDRLGRPVFSSYLHWSLIVNLTPTKNQGQLCFCENSKGERFKPIDFFQDQDAIGDSLRDHSQWRVWKEIDYEYNSAILFPSNYWHTPQNIKCSLEEPRIIFTTWFYSGFNAKYNKCGIGLLDET